MAESSWPTPSNGRVVDDVQYEKLGIGLGPVAGVVGGFTSPQLVYGDSSGMQVKVAADRYATVSGHMWWSGSTIFTKAIGANASGSTRTDLVVLRLSRTTWDATIVVTAGIPGSGAPSPTQNTGTTGSFDLPLATVTVASGAATISAANVTYVGAHLAQAGTFLVPSTAALAYVPLKAAGTIAYDNSTALYKGYDGTNWSTIALNSPAYSGQTQDFTQQSSVSATTYAAGSPVVGFSFVAPPSGIVLVTVGGYLTCSNNTGECRLGWELRTGGTVGSGSVVQASDFRRSVVAGTAVNASAPAKSSASLTIPNSGLTPLATYNIRTMQAAGTAGDNNIISSRILIVQPWVL